MHFKILEGYIMESELYCLLFNNQVQETQVEPTCLLKKKKQHQTQKPNNQNPLDCRTCSLYFSHLF